MKYFTKKEQDLMFQVLDDLAYYSTLHPETDYLNRLVLDKFCDFIKAHKIPERFTIRKYFREKIFNIKVHMYTILLKANKDISTSDFLNR
jgi:hypothetical protein